MPTQESLIIDYLKGIYPEWLEGFRLHGLKTDMGFLGSRTERTCREMYHEGKLEKKMIGKFVAYRLHKEQSSIVKELAALKKNYTSGFICTEDYRLDGTPCERILTHQPRLL